MTNLQGFRLYAEEGSDNVDERSDYTQDVSSLALILPITITVRCRIGDYLNSTSEGLISIIAKMGGASDQLFQIGIIELDNGTYTIQGLDDQTGISDLNAQQIVGGTSIALTLEDWVWLQLELNTDNDMIIKYKDDNTTTKPTSWDTSKTYSGVTNITPTQQLQQWIIQCGNEHGVSTTDRVIIDVDGVYVEDAT